MHMAGTRGFTLVELIVVISMIAILSTIGFVAFKPFSEKRNDDQRFLDINRFAQKLEEFRSQKGAYVCGDKCANVTPTDWYSIDCSNNAQTLLGNDWPLEKNGFLNGGDCCNLQYTLPSGAVVDHRHDGYPSPTSTTDDSSWGLYRFGYAETSLLIDPMEGKPQNGVDYTYCYATPVKGRKSFALFSRLQRSDAGKTDGGLTDDWYEILSDGYPRTGWYPGIPLSEPVCGNGLVESGEQCDDENKINGDGCNSSCRSEYCGDGIIQAGIGEVCDGTNFGGKTCASIKGPGYTGSLGCKFRCTQISAALCTKPAVCPDGVRDPGEVCDTNDLGGMTCTLLDPNLYDGGILGCYDCYAYDPRGCYLKQGGIIPEY